MRKLVLSVIGPLVLAAGFSAPVHAQGQGGYAPGCPGAETVRMSSEERARARAAHQTNDTNGGRSSIDKSCKTWENGGTIAGPQPGAIDWGQTGPHMRGPGKRSAQN
ncbi:MAG TPA: hypothetical protein VN175_12405 [Rhizomicrobium sp.]|nr:hypothetical protein [Rhizomicrobium sp.]